MQTMKGTTVKTIAKKWFKKAPPVGECKKAPSRDELFKHVVAKLAEARTKHDHDIDQYCLTIDDIKRSHAKKLYAVCESHQTAMYNKSQGYEKEKNALTAALDEANERVIAAKEQAARYEAKANGLCRSPSIQGDGGSSF